MTQPRTALQVVTRFAPSPTGYMHLGHAYAAIFAWNAARERNGRFLLRIEDIDRDRCRPEFEDAIFEDLHWLGLDWAGQPRRQSDNMADYKRALNKLHELDLLYPCFCTRKEIQAEIANADVAPHNTDGSIYPGLCRTLTPKEREVRLSSSVPYALRLDMTKAHAIAGPLTWNDREQGTNNADACAGDVVLARKDVPTSYHLAVTLDDHRQRVTLVTRGMDLFHSSSVHRLLQSLLGLNIPEWQHHKLIMSKEGRRLSKRGRALTISALRRAGESPASVRAMVGFD